MPFNKLPRIRDPKRREFVIQIKDMFLEHAKEFPELFYKEDIKLVEDMQFLLQRCIVAKRKNVDESFKMLVTMLKWRKEHKLRELTDASFPVEYFLCGTAFVYEPDKYGNKTLYVRTSYLRNIPEMRASFKEFFAYLIYQIDDAEEGQSWSVILDLTNTGWGNYDINMLTHFLTLLREYFPVNLDYVLAINFPWVLTAAWALAKRLIPPERRDVVAFISHEEVFKYIDEENVPDFLGGTCRRKHSFAPKSSPTTIADLLCKEPKISSKRLREIVKAFSDILPKDHVASMYREVEVCGRP